MQRFEKQRLFDDYAIGYEFFREGDVFDVEAPCETVFKVMWEARVEDVPVITDESSTREKNAYRKKYGPFSLKKFTKRVNECLKEFQMAHLAGPEHAFIIKMWSLYKLYKNCEESLPFIFTRQNLVIAMYEQIQRADIDIGTTTMTAQMAKYAAIATEVVYKIRDHLAQFITDDIRLFLCLSRDAKMYLIRTARDAYKVGRLNKKYGLSSDDVRMIAPSYYVHISEIWAPFLSRNLPLGGDVCKLIAEYIPMRLEGTTFVDYFRRHFNMYKFEYNSDWQPFTVAQTYSVVDYYEQIYVSNITVTFSF